MGMGKESLEFIIWAYNKGGIMKVSKLKKSYKKEEERHDKAYKKENTKHEKKHIVEIDEALQIGKKKKK